MLILKRLIFIIEESSQLHRSPTNCLTKHPYMLTSKVPWKIVICWFFYMFVGTGSDQCPETWNQSQSYCRHIAYDFFNILYIILNSILCLIGLFFKWLFNNRFDAYFKTALKWNDWSLSIQLVETVCLAWTEESMFLSDTTRSSNLVIK